MISHDCSREPRVTAIVLAAGAGDRAMQGVPKQFVQVDGTPILVHTLRAINSSASIDAIVCVVPGGWVDVVSAYRSEWDVPKLDRVVVGGRTWLESLWLGLRSADANQSDIVLVHDGARPFVTPNIVEENLALARANPAVVTAVPLTETLAYCDDGRIASSTVARDGLWRVQTPQTFWHSVLDEVLDGITDWGSVMEPSVFSLYVARGGSVRIARGSERNLKVTYPEDVEYLRGLFSGC